VVCVVKEVNNKQMVDTVPLTGTTKEMMAPKDNSGAMRTTMMCLLVVYSVLASAHIYSLKGAIWFTWHPIVMITSFILLTGFAILIKKAGGYANTKTHVYLMVAAVVGACFGWYVIYSNKEMYNKPHLATLHGQLGVAVCLAYIGMVVFAGPALNPDWGYFRTDKTIRFCHKWSGRVFAALAWICCVYGFNTMETRFEYQIAFALPLLGFAVFILL
jgi:hypothetical protein